MHSHDQVQFMGLSAHNLSPSSSLQISWAQVKEYEPLHVPKAVELCFKVGPCIFKFKPKPELGESSSPILTSSRLGRNLKSI